MGVTVVNVETHAKWHPHFTPGWLSKELAAMLPANFVGAVVDPACGAGNLLLSAAHRLCAYKRNDVRLIGADVSQRALADCRQLLRSVVKPRNLVIRRANFLYEAVRTEGGIPTAVVMNPPFCGYGKMSKHIRRLVRSTLQMSGRFNLGYAFVMRALRIYKPIRLISILPSNWLYSRNSRFRSELERFEGTWDWQDVGAAAFDGVATHVGILSWEPGRAGVQSLQVPRCDPEARTVEVRLGVATGGDAVFSKAAERGATGIIVRAVRGRDIGRDQARSLWLAPSTADKNTVTNLSKALGSDLCARLKGRSCVTSGRRQWWETHEAWPAWFLGAPKLLLPEIVTGAIRVEVDSDGTRFPLHSVIAVRVDSVTAGYALMAHLRRPAMQRQIFERAPRLNGDSRRLQVGLVRDLVGQWMDRNSGG